ncbi:LysE family translocator [Nitrincola sp. MINF-07-Sa-05]|uniref:LysE family translocator n=1 Tax=Nitrincola salilacus TaxID=3400273 RepID=UPI0039181E9B
MDLVLFIKSLFLGLAVAAPLGPIGALCINRTLERGFIAGVAGGLGTACADGVYATLAAIGFVAFSGTLANLDIPLRLAGGTFMLWLGWKSMTPKPSKSAAEVSARHLLETVAATFLLTATNPMTILSFAALFAGLGLASTTDKMGSALVVVGVFVGSMLWWTFLSAGIALIRHRLPDVFAHWVSRLSGILLIGFGIWALSSSFI